MRGREEVRPQDGGRLSGSIKFLRGGYTIDGRTILTAGGAGPLLEARN